MDTHTREPPGAAPADDSVLIRPAVATDAESIAQIHIMSWREAYSGIVPDDYLADLNFEARHAQWTTVLSSTEAQTWVAEFNLHTVGFAHLGPCRDEDAEPQDLEIYAIYLQPDMWGQGVARKLMSTILTTVEPKTPVSLWVFAENRRAQHFYRRHGFCPDGVEKLEEIGGRTITEKRFRRG